MISRTHSSDKLPVYYYGHTPFTSMPYFNFKLIRDGQEVDELVTGAICSNMIVRNPPIDEVRITRANYCDFVASMNPDTTVYLFDNSCDKRDNISLTETTLGSVFNDFGEPTEQVYFILPRWQCEIAFISDYKETFHDYLNQFKGDNYSIACHLHNLLCKPIRDNFRKRIYLSYEGNSFRVNLTELIYVELNHLGTQEEPLQFEITNYDWLQTNLNKDSEYFAIISALINTIHKVHTFT